ncbi:MAG TPA: GMC family oxidoreductase [Gemmatimonadaceae bacterium]|nr:GMC family oxidoreductase [Gemmatimonadaceae bacterium]
MTFVQTKRETYDAIVVGSGITGGWAAKELTEKGLRTLVIERGRHVEHGRDYTTEWLRPWELPHRGRGDRELYARDYPIQSMNYAFGEATKHFFVNDREHPYLVPDGQPFRWIRGYHLGGRSLIWGRACWRWSDLDFEANLRDGHGVDWPIRYRDLAPWYDHVERFIGVSGEKLGLAHLPDGDFLPPWQLTCAEKTVKEGIERAYPGRRLTLTRVANLTRAHGGRSACQARDQCARGCSFGAYFSSLSSTLPAAHATGRLTVVTDAVVESVIYDEKQGRATGVRVIDAKTREAREYSGRLVFLNASTLGTAQILLNSRSALFPDGLANSSGEIGHNVMDHLSKAGARGEVAGLEDEYTYGRRPTGSYIPRFRNLGARADSANGFIRGYGIQAGAGRGSWSRGASGPGLGVELKERLREPGPWRMTMQGYCECLPRHENHVALDPERKDQWGIPLLHVNVSWSDNERALREDLKTQAAEMLDAAGCRDVQTWDDDAPPGFSVHEMGTARMGRDPRTSVLNAHNQAHDVPNLYVTDGSCMASSSCVNPSLTYMALTARAVDHAVEELKRRNL